MISRNRIFRIPRPRTFLYLMTLRTGTELSTLALLLNKVSGFYGLLALLTGFYLSPVQLSMYLYSLLALVLVAVLARHIRTQAAFENLALAVFFIFDTFINAVYTAIFGVTWFMVVSEHHVNKATGAEGTMDQTAGFTKPEHKNVSSVDVVVGPDQGVPGSSHEAITAGNSGGGNPSVGHGFLQPESMSSMFMIVALWIVRVYLVLIVMSYARSVIRRHVAAVSRSRPEYLPSSKGTAMLEDPFARHLPEGKGWRGRLGRLMIGISEGYWLGVEEGDESWGAEEIGMGRLRRNDEAPGVVERERRRRSGTVSLKMFATGEFDADWITQGPPPPPPIPQLQGENSQYLRVEGRTGK
ncbi:uncharacterized protein KY384_007575 [Bacidia gigantensis]|uniref:uncharacterized protein n=1 Tax=Bacidia gigantensis TaxID=2732470 RepID=UPI001D03DDA3|nr:uncharacterized protein KY384_007575 [Bacidia gigantensis]KAG8527423.1 hypothetical protein KY384_007575 [Bacidia gigantensis]